MLTGCLLVLEYLASTLLEEKLYGDGLSYYLMNVYG